MFPEILLPKANQETITVLHWFMLMLWQNCKAETKKIHKICPHCSTSQQQLSLSHRTQRHNVLTLKFNVVSKFIHISYSFLPEKKHKHICNFISSYSMLSQTCILLPWVRQHKKTFCVRPLDTHWLQHIINSFRVNFDIPVDVRFERKRQRKRW